MKNSLPWFQWKFFKNRKFNVFSCYLWILFKRLIKSVQRRRRRRRWRSRIDVWLRDERDWRMHAADDHACAQSEPQNGRVAKDGSFLRVAAPRFEDAGHVRARAPQWRGHPHARPHSRHFCPARWRDHTWRATSSAQIKGLILKLSKLQFLLDNRRGHSSASHRRKHDLPSSTFRQIRHWRSTRRRRPHRQKNHCRHLRRMGSSWRRRLLRQGLHQG